MTTKRRDGRDVTPFAEWVRTNKELDSFRACVTNHDIDWIWHKYLVSCDTYGKRTINHVMFIEEKSFGKDLTMPQREIMYLLDQVLRRTKTIRLYNLQHQEIAVRFWGYFKLRYDGESLPASSWIKWNKNTITTEQLTQILRFELNPRTLKPRSDRRHHKAPDVPLLKLIEP